MKKEDLFSAIGEVDEQLLARTEINGLSAVIAKKRPTVPHIFQPQRRLPRSWISAAGLLLAVSILIATLLVGGKYGFQLPPLDPLPSGDQQGFIPNNGSQSGGINSGLMNPTVTTEPTPPVTTEPTPPVTTEEPTPVHPDPNREKKDILSIPGAMLVENPVFVDTQTIYERMDFSSVPEDIIASARKQFLAIAEMENLKCYVIPRTGYVWYLVTFDLRIITPLTNIGDKEVLENCIMGWRTQGEHQGNICGIHSERASNMESFSGVYIACEAQKMDFLIDGLKAFNDGTRYNAGDYADYYVSWRYDYDEDSYDCHGVDILFEDIRK
ncbi:MAG: hypothetical protein IJX28_00980 [Clostridia bacterium]|nr:hypothetical protein [Clostridia bacterium]